MKSTKFSALNQADKDWWIVDAKDKILGRLATRIATKIMGKDKVSYNPHHDNGDFIVVVNCEHILCTSKDKQIWWHTGYPGGIRSKKASDESPDRLLYRAVQRMLARGPLAREMMKKLKVYNGTSHPHSAQNPKELTIDTTGAA